MENTWINHVVPITGAVKPVSGKAGVVALLCWRDGVASLRVSEDVVHSEGAVDAVEKLARQHDVHRIETQGKFFTDGLPMRLLRARGFSVVGSPVIHFRVEVAAARHRLEHLRLCLGDRALSTVSADQHDFAQIAAVVDSELMLDDFELRARLAHQGAGAISATECPVMLDAGGLAGFVLISRVDDPIERELIVRWVAPRHRRTAMVNLALLLDCLDRAAAAGITVAHFSANPQRHNDTMRLACSLRAERCGESFALVRELV